MVQYTRRFRVQFADLDAQERLTDVAVLQYLQETAIEASTALGYNSSWYRERKTAWVARKLIARIYDTATYGEDIAIDTWISRIQGVRSSREYSVRFGDSSRLLARIRTEWVYVDLTSGQPSRPPQEILGIQTFPGDEDDFVAREFGSRSNLDGPRYTTQRRVQYGELDAAQHVNHVVYLRWANDAMRDAMRMQRLYSRSLGHEIVFSSPAFEGDEIKLTSWVCESVGDRFAWTHEIAHAESGKLFAKIRSCVLCKSLLL